MYINLHITIDAASSVEKINAIFDGLERMAVVQEAVKDKELLASLVKELCDDEDDDDEEGGDYHYSENLTNDLTNLLFGNEGVMSNEMEEDTSTSLFEDVSDEELEAEAEAEEASDTPVTLRTVRQNETLRQCIQRLGSGFFRKVEVQTGTGEPILTFEKVDGGIRVTETGEKGSNVVTMTEALAREDLELSQARGVVLVG